MWLFFVFCLFDLVCFDGRFFWFVAFVFYWFFGGFLVDFFPNPEIFSKSNKRSSEKKRLKDPFLAQEFV